MNVRAGFERLYETLVGSSQSHPCADAQERRHEALRAVEDAAQRGDDRDYGRALMELRQATSDALAASLREQHPTQAGGSR